MKKTIITILVLLSVIQVFAQKVVLSGVSANTTINSKTVATVGQLSTEVKAGGGVKIYEGMYHYFGFSTPNLIATGSISALQTSINQASANSNFTVSGTYLGATVVIKAPTGFEVSTNASSGFANQITINVANKTLASTVVYIRIAATATSGTVTGGNVTISSANSTKTLTVPNGTVNAAATPIITLGTSSLIAFSATVGSVSVAQSFTVAGSNLTSGISVSVPAGYEISTSETVNYGTSAISFTQSSGGGVIWVRIPSSASIGSIPSTTITVKSGGANDRTVTIPQGKVNGIPSIGTNKLALTSFSTYYGTASFEQNFKVSGTNLSNNLVITPPNKYEVSKTSGSGFASSVLLVPNADTVGQTTIYIRLKANAGIGAVALDSVSVTSIGATTKKIAIPVGIVNEALVASITTSGTFTTFNAQQSFNSATQTFTLQGVNLSSNINITLPAGYEIATSLSGAYTNSLAITPTGGTVSQTTLYVRTISTLAVGAIAAGDVTIKSTGVTDITLNIPVGKVTEYLIAVSKSPTNLATNSNDSVYVKLTANATSPTVTLRYKKITEANTAWKSKTLTADANGKYASLINKDSLGEIGLEYYFDIAYAGSKTSQTDTFTTYKKYVSALNGPTLPGGTTVSAYQIISFPFNLDSANSQLVSTYLGALANKGNTEFRLFRYNATSKAYEEYPSQFDTFENGRGYFIIVKDGNSLPTYSGLAHNVTSQKPFEIQLKSGWNLIGNPYNFILKWTELFNASGFASANFRTYQGAFGDGTIINPFSGGFVYVSSASTLKIPVVKNTSINLRVDEELNFDANTEYHSNQDWQMNFLATQNQLKNNLIGIGMHPNADSLFDKFDQVSSPKLSDYLDLNVNHKASANINFSKDVVPTTDNKTWIFNVDCNNKKDNIHLTWEAPYLLNNNLYLIDSDNNKIVNLKEQTNYSFKPSNTNQSLRIVLGDENYINANVTLNETSIISLAPNPVVNTFTLDYYLVNEAPSSTIIIKDLLGNTVLVQNGLSNKGYNSTKVNIADLASGLYLVELHVEDKVLISKIIKN